MNRRRILAAWAKSGYTAKDYVQDGLIAMWDGIENAGWGVHDPNAVEWVDIVGSRKATLNDVIVGDDNMYFNGSSSYANIGYSSIFKSQELTLECCFKTNTPTSAQSIINTGAEGVALFLAGSGLRLVCVMSKTAGYYSIVPNGNNQTISICFSGSDSVKAFQDSIKLSVGGTGIVGEDRANVVDIGRRHIGGTGYRDFANAYISRISVYSRVLTDAEVAANYAIDKARFNLPDAT